MSDDNQPVDRERVVALLEQYGADPERFPDAEREGALALLQSDAELMAMQREAAALDGLLDAFEPTPPSGELARRVAEIPLRHPQAVSAGSWLALLGLGRRGWLQAGLAGALAGAMGVALGVASIPIDNTRDGDPTVLAATEAELAAEAIAEEDAWEELASLAFADDLTLDALNEDLDEETQAL